MDLDRPSDWRSQAVSQVRRNERDVAGFLGWGARKDARITSLVVVWGPQVRQQGDEAVLTPEGVNVLAGRHLRMVLGDLGEEALSPQEVEAIYTKLAGWIEKKDSWNASASAEAPVTLSEQAERAMWSGVKLSIGFVLVAAALVALAQLLT